MWAYVLLVLTFSAAGISVHPGDGEESPVTVVNALLYYLQSTGEKLSEGEHPLRPGIVHRLDKGVRRACIFGLTR
jgi:23S rRNA-/tRNA-specific pseudouridylate synthase